MVLGMVPSSWLLVCSLFAGPTTEADQEQEQQNACHIDHLVHHLAHKSPHRSKWMFCFEQCCVNVNERRKINYKSWPYILKAFSKSIAKKIRTAFQYRLQLCSYHLQIGRYLQVRPQLASDLIRSYRKVLLHSFRWVQQELLEYGKLWVSRGERKRSKHQRSASVSHPNRHVQHSQKVDVSPINKMQRNMRSGLEEVDVIQQCTKHNDLQCFWFASPGHFGQEWKLF